MCVSPRLISIFTRSDGWYMAAGGSPSGCFTRLRHVDWRCFCNMINSPRLQCVSARAAQGHSSSVKKKNIADWAATLEYDFVPIEQLVANSKKSSIALTDPQKKWRFFPFSHADARAKVITSKICPTCSMKHVRKLSAMSPSLWQLGFAPIYRTKSYSVSSNGRR